MSNTVIIEFSKRN